jgi:hypothetical protein
MYATPGIDATGSPLDASPGTEDDQPGVPPFGDVIDEQHGPVVLDTSRKEQQ